MWNIKHQWSVFTVILNSLGLPCIMDRSTKWWFYNNTYWSFGKQFTELCIPLHSIKNIVNINQLFRKVFRVWEVVKFMVIDTNFPKFYFCFNAWILLLTKKIWSVVFLEISGSFYSIKKKKQCLPNI